MYFCYNKIDRLKGGYMKKEKKIKLKGSSFLDKNKPINKKRRSNDKKVSINISSKKKPLSNIPKSSKSKNKSRAYKKKTYTPLNSNQKQQTTNRYLPDIIEKRYIFIIIYQ